MLTDHTQDCSLSFDGPGCTCKPLAAPAAAPAAAGAFKDVVNYLGIAVAAERERCAVLAERMAKEWSEKYPARREFDAGYMAGCVAVAREVRK